jgi:hypothetical protein
MRRTREKILEERKRLKVKYGELFDATAAMLFRHDPSGISFENQKTDEYDPEAGTILPRLSSCHSSEDVRGVLHEEFCRCFGTDNAGPPERYAPIASELWQLWQGHLHKQNAS